MKAFDGAIKELYFVLVMLCMGRDRDRIANAPRGWSTRAWRLLIQTCSPKSDARLMMMVVLDLLLDTNKMAAEAVWESSLEGASESSGGSRDSEIVCWNDEKQRTSECHKMRKDHDNVTSAARLVWA